MAVFAQIAVSTIVLVILVVARHATGSQGYFFGYRCLVTFGASDILVFTIQLKVGFIMVEIPSLPITGVMASLTFRPQCAFMHILFFVARPAIRFGILESRRQMAFLAFDQYMFSGELEA